MSKKNSILAFAIFLSFILLPFVLISLAYFTAEVSSSGVIMENEILLDNSINREKIIKEDLNTSNLAIGENLLINGINIKKNVNSTNMYLRVKMSFSGVGADLLNKQIMPNETSNAKWEKIENYFYYTDLQGNLKLVNDSNNIKFLDKNAIKKEKGVGDVSFDLSVKSIDGNSNPTDIKDGINKFDDVELKDYYQLKINIINGANGTVQTMPKWMKKGSYSIDIIPNSGFYAKVNDAKLEGKKYSFNFNQNTAIKVEFVKSSSFIISNNNCILNGLHAKLTPDGRKFTLIEGSSKPTSKTAGEELYFYSNKINSSYNNIDIFFNQDTFIYYPNVQYDVPSENTVIYCVFLKPNVNGRDVDLKNVIGNNQNAIISHSVQSIIGSENSSRATLKKAIVPGNVKKIGAFSFYQTGLTGIICLPGLERVDRYAFYKCASLSNVYLSDTLKVVQEWAFFGTDWYNKILSTTSSAVTKAGVPFKVSTINGNSTQTFAYYLPYSNNINSYALIRVDRDTTQLEIHAATTVIFSSAFVSFEDHMSDATPDAPSSPVMNNHAIKELVIPQNVNMIERVEDRRIFDKRYFNGAFYPTTELLTVVIKSEKVLSNFGSRGSGYNDIGPGGHLCRAARDVYLPNNYNQANLPAYFTDETICQHAYKEKPKQEQQKYTDMTWVHRDIAEINTCVVHGTNITLADGSQKKVEDITYHDPLLVKDMINGGFTVAYPTYIFKQHTQESYNIITFDDGTKLKFACNHGIWSVDSNLFVETYLNDFYVGMKSLKLVMDKNGNAVRDENGEFKTKQVTVTKLEHVEQEIYKYTITTAVQYNSFAEGILITDVNTEFSNFYGFEKEDVIMNREVREPVINGGYGENGTLYSYEDYQGVIPHWMYIGMRAAEGRYAVETLKFCTYEEWLYVLGFELSPNDYVAPFTKGVIENGVNIIKNVWAVSTSNDNICKPDYVTRKIFENDKFILPSPKENNGKEFLGWRSNIDNKIYAIGETVPIYISTHFTALWK